MRKTLTSFILAVVATMAIVASAAAAITTYTGLDGGVGPGGARPNSDAAAASFDAAAAALGTLSSEGFESAPLGNFVNLVLTAMTVTLTGTGSDANAGITNVTGDNTLGYNTTSGGTKHLRFVPPFGIGTRTVTFSYVVPIQAWGSYFTGVGTVPNTTVTVKFNDGTAQSFGVPGASNGGVSFFGFTDPGKAIVSVTVQEDLTSSSSRDIFSIDDVRFVPAIEVTKDWRFPDVCFEKDNDVDCPNGTSPGTPLPTNLDGDFQVQAVLKKDGTLSSYNPGQVYAVSTVTALADLEVLEITEHYADCTDDSPQILTLNPAVGGGGGSVVVVIDTGDGVLTQILDANSPGVTVTNSQATVTLTDVAEGTIIRVYVKFGPGAKRQVLGLPTSCENENSAQVLDEAGSPVGPEVTATAVLEVTANP